MSAHFVLLVVLVAVLAGGLGYVNWRIEQRRRAELLGFATNNHWHYVVEDDSYCQRWQGPPFHQGDHRRSRNVITGERQGHPFAAFDYSFQTHSNNGQGGRNTTTHRYAVYALGLPAYLPGLAVTPESLLSRLGDAIGFADIHLESEDFNRRFRVRSNDPKFAYDVLSPRTMELLMSHTERRWRIEGDTILAWETGRISPVEVLASLTLLESVVTGIPAYVWHDHGVSSDPTPSGGSA